jgi:DNA-binding NtrC family response regulator
MSPTYDAMLNPPSRPRSGACVSILTVLCDPDERTGFLSQLCRSKWDIQSATTFEKALTHLRTATVGVVVAQYRPSGRLSWRTLLDELHHSTPAPRLIVTDHLADRTMWMEVTKSGAHDLLTQPFARDEIFRVLAHAWCSWKAECSAWRQPAGCAT